MNFSLFFHRLSRTAGVLGCAASVLVATTGAASAHDVVSTAIKKDGITVNSAVEISDGIIHGTLNASSAKGEPLRYEFLGSSNGGKLAIGTVPTSPSGTDPQSFTILPYATWLDGAAKGTETFRVRVSEIANAKKSVVATINVDVAALAPEDTPVAFTYKVISFNGIRISTNFFPASGLAAGETAPIVFNGPGFAIRGVTNPYAEYGDAKFVPGPAMLRDAGYNEVTWDSRGTFASGGAFQLSSPFFEGRDVSELISWASASTPTEMNGPGDPAIGLIGAGLGGAVQFASVDPRIDAVVPAMTWNSLLTALNPLGVFKSKSASRLIEAFHSAGARLNSNLEHGIAEGVRTGRLSAATRALLVSSGPTSLLNQLQAPTLLIQSTVDSTFPLQESINNAETIINNPYGVPMKMSWFNSNRVNNEAMFERLRSDTIAWLDQYVDGAVGRPAEGIPNFQWWDQHGTYRYSSLYPFSPGFNSPDSVSVTRAKGSLKILAGNSVDVSSVTIPVTLTIGSMIVGAPVLTFTYQGTGNARAVFARIVNKGTGKVLGRIDSPVPIMLDGAAHTVSVPLADIVFSCTADADSQLEVQIRSAGTGFSRLGSGTVSLTNIEANFPIVD